MKFIKFYNDGADDAIISQFAQKFNIDKRVMEIIYSKGYKTEQQVQSFLEPLNQPFINPFDLSGMKECVDIILDATKKQKDILIFGDYDVDGISATSIMIKTLKKLGVDARYYLPNRFIDGYGLTNAVIDKICANQKPDLIVTVDCGISCKNEVEYCKSLGIDIVVTDHHEIPEELPNTVIVNPKLPNQKYTFNGLCGTGVAFKISQALVGFENCEDILPIAAIATIADIVPLTDENRVIVSKGLKLFNKHLPYGLRQMVKQNKLNINAMDASDIAFKIAPKLNASGRMGDASDSLELIMETDPVKVKALLDKINSHNLKRQELCNKVYEDCVEMLKYENMSELPAIILKSNDWDSGILGIVCSRLVDMYNRPVILFSNIDGELKGSARSIDDVNIHQVLNSVKELLEVFGGHKVAAGLTLKEQNFEEFKNRVCAFIVQNINTKAFIPIEYYDVELNVNELNQKMFDDLKKIEPCGCENQKPRFLVKSNSIKINPLKPNSTHAYINIGKKLNLIFFNYVNEYPRLNFGKEYDFIFELQSTIKGGFKGIVKSFTTSDNIKDTAYQYFNAFKFNQLLHIKGEKNTIKTNLNTYKESELINFVVDCSSSVFGTCFVCFNIDKYKNFISSYDLTNVFEINFIDSNTTGFNTVNLCPQDISWAKSYKKIIFLDTVIDMSYINAIQKISKAQIFVPEIDATDKNLFLSLNLDRAEISKFYINLTKAENGNYTSILSVYTKIVKELKYKINFNNFLIYFYILTDLKIVSSYTKDGLFSFKINRKIKTDLNKSKIYNCVKLLRRVYG